MYGKVSLEFRPIDKCIILISFQSIYVKYFVFIKIRSDRQSRYETKWNRWQNDVNDIDRSDDGTDALVNIFWNIKNQ